MSFNGSGVFVVNSTGQPVVATTLIEASVFNAFTADVATGLSTTICKDGQTVITANIPLAGFKLTGVGAATARTDAATLASIQDGTGVYVATVGGTADVITLTVSPPITAYAAGQTFRFIASGANTTNVTVNVSSLGAKAITKNGTTALVAGDIPSATMVEITYDGTRFILGTIGASVSTLATGAIPKSLVTTAGDTIYATASATLARLGIGTANQVYRTNSGATAPEWATLVVDNGTNDFRLTLTTALPVTTSDVTAATTIYCTPYKGNRIALYDGSSTWNVRTSAEFSIAIGTLAAQRMHDVFVYDNAGVPTLELLIWTNDTTRATALTTQDGVLVKTGATTRRYVGSFYPTSTTQMADSMANRFLWNYYNRVDRPMRSALETADTWTYTLAAFQQANANTANQLNYVVGVDEVALEATVAGAAQNSNTGVFVSVGIGLDSTTAKATGCLCSVAEMTAANDWFNVFAQWRGYTGAVGKHYLAWLEYSIASGTTTWAGDIATPNFVQSGIVGMIRG